MGFFEKISRSPSEKKVAAHFKEENRRIKSELAPNQQILPEVRSLTLELFQISVQEDSNWKATVKALSNYKEIAKKANSPEDLKRAAELHALAYMKDIWSLDANHPLVSTFPNLKSHWYKVYEDLTDMYLAGKYLNMDPNDLTEILGSLSYLDNEIIQRFSGTDELGQWIENRRYQRKDYPALRDLEQM